MQEDGEILGLDYTDERWVKLYTRDTINWQLLSFEAQGLLTLLLRKVDRAGVIPNQHGKLGVFVGIGHRHRAKDLEPALDELLDSGAATLTKNAIVLPKFLQAQEAKTSDAQRQRDLRERRSSMARAEALGVVTQRDSASRSVTKSHVQSRGVTTRVDETRRDNTKRSLRAVAADLSSPCPPLNSSRGSPSSSSSSKSARRRKEEEEVRRDDREQRAHLVWDEMQTNRWEERGLDREDMPKGFPRFLEEKEAKHGEGTMVPAHLEYLTEEQFAADPKSGSEHRWCFAVFRSVCEQRLRHAAEMKRLEQAG